MIYLGFEILNLRFIPKIMKQLDEKTLIIVGSTAAGKSDLAILLAQKYNGEVISADSRQVYRGMDIGTGKVTRDKVIPHAPLSEGSWRVPETEGWGKMQSKKKNINNTPSQSPPFKGGEVKKIQSLFFSEGIRHHLLDVASPKRSYNVTHFVRDAKKAITDIKKHGKIPIICGGTGFWVQALVEDNVFPAVKPDVKLRKRLGKLSAEKLFAMLKKKDKERAATIDAKNKVRLIRALEICESLGTVPPLRHPELVEGSTLSLVDSSTRPPRLGEAGRLVRNDKGSFLIIGINPDKETLQKNIKIRLEKRLKKGMLAEVKHLHADGVNWKRLESFGLEYKNVALFLQKKITREAMRQNILQESIHYAKRQLSYLRRFEKMGTTIHWIADSKEALKVVRKSTVVIPSKAEI